MPNSGLIGDGGQLYYSDSLQSVDAEGNLTTEFIFKVKGASVDGYGGARSFCTKSVDRLLLACYYYHIAKV